MNQNLKIDHLWNALTTEEVKDACRFIFESDDERTAGVRREILESLAESFHFRLVSLQRKSADELGRFLVQRVGRRDFHRFRRDLLVPWWIQSHAQMFEWFFTSSDISQYADTILGEDADDVKDRVPQAEHFIPGIRALQERAKPREMGIFLGYFVLFGGGLFQHLTTALNECGVSIELLLGEIGPHEIQSKVINENAEIQQPIEYSDEFTTLDNLLIRTAVASAFGEIGALTKDELEDLVEEVAGLNATRQHTLFHRGYLHALFDMPLVLHFPGENEERRLWYFAGSLFGFLRRGKKQQILDLLKNEKDLAQELSSSKGRCGSMVLPHVYPLLWDEGQYELLRKWSEHQILRMRMDLRCEFVDYLHNNASALLRRGRWAEVVPFLDLIHRVLETGEGWPEGFADHFLPMNNRKRAQALQLKGDFAGAESILHPLIDLDAFDDKANVLADLGLIHGGFRSLAAILPKRHLVESTPIYDALTKGEEFFEKAVRESPASATNAHFCLGVATLLGKTEPTVAADHLKNALSGMLQNTSAYDEASLIQWTRFLLGIALLECFDSAEYQNARELLDSARSAEGVFPIWLWERALSAASVFDDPSLAQGIAEHLLGRRDTDAYRALWNSGILSKSPSLRKVYLGWMTSTKRPDSEKWDCLVALLPEALKDGSLEQSEDILDAMEGLAEQGAPYRQRFRELLQDDTRFSPAWELGDAQNVTIRLNELEGRFEEAAALLRGRFFYLRERADAHSLSDAGTIVERIKTYGLPEDRHSDLARLLDPVDTVTPNEINALLQDIREVRVLYIGGNETQEAYTDAIRRDLTERYPWLHVNFFLPGWSSSWGVQLDQIRPELMKSHAVVLSTMVRTQFGRHIRRLCDGERPWFPCTGRGRQSLTLSIEAAALWAARKQQEQLAPMGRGNHRA